MKKCNYCNKNSDGRNFCNRKCFMAFNRCTRGQKLIDEIMSDPSKVLASIPLKPTVELTRLDELRAKIEQRYFFSEEKLPSSVILRLEPEEAKILNHVVQMLDLPRENVFMIGMFALFRRIRTIETEEFETPLEKQKVSPTAGEQEVPSG